MDMGFTWQLLKLCHNTLGSASISQMEMYLFIYLKADIKQYDAVICHTDKGETNQGECYNMV